jgi:dTDP-4-dehydrorhamnose reductase
MKKPVKLFVHGISGWIGFYAAEYVSRVLPHIELYGTHRAPAFTPTQGNLRVLKIEKSRDCLDLLRQIKPEFFLNLARGEMEEDFSVHQSLIEALNSLGSHYSYTSSSNACDNNASETHHESEKSNAKSDYGKFKARCEVELEKYSNSFSAFRFSAIHGWAPNRRARTETFLQRLRAGEQIKVNCGILQNRTFVGDLAGMMVDATLNRGRGIFHLGTVDFSDELDFLRGLASVFGYPEDQVVRGDLMPCNIVMAPQKILELFGGKWRRTEAETLDSVAKSVPLRQYKHG